MVDDEDEDGDDGEGLSEEMMIERLMLALGLQGWLMVPTYVPLEAHFFDLLT